MICVVIKGPSYQDAHHQILQALEFADVVELRLDLFENLDISALKQLCISFDIPMILTLRSQSQGGDYRNSESDLLADIHKIAELEPAYIDLEHTLPSHFIEELHVRHPSIKIILSYHNFRDTPQDLEGIYQTMRSTLASFYKIAVTACSSTDALRFLCWAKNFKGKVIPISIGSYGQISRILAPIVGTPFTYATIDESQQTAPGQIPAEILIKRYHYRSLTPQTAVYGLIGDPITRSISDKTHNAFFHSNQLDAVYVKMQVSALELCDFLKFARELPLRGLSVTMPLKESILPHLDSIDKQAEEVGAVNTIVMQEGKYLGYNTDGIGALNAIEERVLVKGKRIVLIGAGGASKAIAHEAYRRGGLLTIVNRDLDKARLLADRYQGEAIAMEQMSACAKDGYDILINCTPLAMPISANHILPSAVVMDITTNPKDTPFLKCALQRGCQVVYGYQMFIGQAMGQFNLWLATSQVHCGKG